MDSFRKDLLVIFDAAVKRVAGETVVATDLGDYDLQDDWHLLAIGKAAADMTSGALLQLGHQIKRGLVITKQDHSLEEITQDYPQVEQIESDHPVPTQRSLDAGKRLVEFIEETPADGNLLFLISGGASSLVEVLPDGMELADLQAMTDWLLSNGLDIRAMNSVRRAVSCIKGGRLAMQLKGRDSVCLMISDVPGDKPATIGSGLLHPGSIGALPELPAFIQKWVDRAPPQPKPEDVIIPETRIIASQTEAKRAARIVGEQLGYKVFLHEPLLLGDVNEVADYIATTLKEGENGLYIWGGEPTVVLPEDHGQGGRNQQLALLLATRLADKNHCYFLAAGTDGTDGPTNYAGALVDGSTITRGELMHYRAEEAVKRCDAMPFLRASGDLVVTDPTGTNVMDLMMGLKI